MNTKPPNSSGIKSRQRLALACLLAFALSYFLPALQENRGYECFWLCVGVLKKLPETLGEIGGWLYYSCFVLSNLAVVVFAALSFAGRRLPLWTAITMTIFTLHVVSWPLVNLTHIEDIEIGYYLWLGAYLALTCSIFKYPGARYSAD